MATRPDPVRRGERGLSLIEALVIVSATALMALILLPLVSGAAGRNFGIAQRAVSWAEAAAAERDFRELLRAALSDERGAPIISGRTTELVLAPALAHDLACASAGGPHVVRLSIVPDSGLYCLSEGRRTPVLNWRAGQARFLYSADGRLWDEAWAGGAAALVRFELSQPGTRRLQWIERAGAAAP